MRNAEWYGDFGQAKQQSWTEIQRIENAAEQHRARADKLEEQAEKCRERAATLDIFSDEFPEDIVDTIIYFKKRFHNSSTQYTYSAVCYKDWSGHTFWASTGPKAPKGFTRAELIAWLASGDGVDELWVATEFEKIV
jgi:hypothetical protein